MTGRVYLGRTHLRTVVLVIVLAAGLLGEVAAETGTAIPESGANGVDRLSPEGFGDLTRGDKARLAWRVETEAESETPGRRGVLEDVMSRDQIIEEFGVFDPVNRIPGPPREPTTAIPIPRTLPVNPGVLRFRPLHRIQQMVRDDLYQYFDLYLYINKAPKGVWAQKMFVYERLPNGQFRQLFRWLGSTGRERNERYFTTTPVGVFKLDPQRMREMYYSVQWGGVAMPYAMFIDFRYGSRKSGIAIHGTSGRTENNLGHRASGGCIRLSVDNSRMLYYLIQTNYEGMVPEFTFDGKRGHTSKTGQLLLDENGDVVMKPGYRVLLIVDYVTN